MMFLAKVVCKATVVVLFLILSFYSLRAYALLSHDTPASHQASQILIIATRDTDRNSHEPANTQSKTTDTITNSAIIDPKKPETIDSGRKLSAVISRIFELPEFTFRYLAASFGGSDVISIELGGCPRMPTKS